MTSDRQPGRTEQSAPDVFESALRTSWWEILGVIVILASLPIVLFVEWVRDLLPDGGDDD